VVQVLRKLDRRSLPPCGPMKTRPSSPGWAKRSRCQRSSGAIYFGNATRRRPACDFGSSSISLPSSVSAVETMMQGDLVGEQVPDVQDFFARVLQRGNNAIPTARP